MSVSYLPDGDDYVVLTAETNHRLATALHAATSATIELASQDIPVDILVLADETERVLLLKRLLKHVSIHERHEVIRHRQVPAARLRPHYFSCVSLFQGSPRAVRAWPSVVEVETVQAGAMQPFMSPCGKVHRQVDVSPQCPEPSSVESPYGSDVAGNGADGQVLITMDESLFDDSGDEPMANTLIPRCLGDNDRLYLGTCSVVEQTGQADDCAVELGHPGSDPLGRGEIAIESRPGVVAANRRVPIDAPVVLRQL